MEAVLIILKKLLGKIPFTWYIILGLVITILVWGQIRFHQGASSVKAQIKTEVKYIKAVSPQVTASVVTKYVDRVRVIHDKGRTIIKKVPIYVTSKDNAQCVINNGFVELWNAANQMRIPDTTTTFNEKPSNVILTDVAAEHAKEAQIQHETEQQLISLQEWVKAQQKLYNGQ